MRRNRFAKFIAAESSAPTARFPPSLGPAAAPECDKPRVSPARPGACSVHGARTRTSAGSPQAESSPSRTCSWSFEQFARASPFCLSETPFPIYLRFSLCPFFAYPSLSRIKPSSRYEAITGRRSDRDWRGFQPRDPDQSRSLFVSISFPQPYTECFSRSHLGRSHSSLFLVPTAIRLGPTLSLEFGATGLNLWDNKECLCVVRVSLSLFLPCHDLSSRFPHSCRPSRSPSAPLFDSSSRSISRARSPAPLPPIEPRLYLSPRERGEQPRLSNSHKTVSRGRPADLCARPSFPSLVHPRLAPPRLSPFDPPYKVLLALHRRGGQRGPRVSRSRRGTSSFANPFAEGGCFSDRSS